MNKKIRLIISLTLAFMLVVSYLSNETNVGRAAESLALGTDSSAKWITLDGVVVPGTEVYKANYDLTIPWDYAQGLYSMVLEAELNDPKASVTVRRSTRPTRPNGDRDWLIILTITSEDGNSTTKYKLNIIKQANPANLLDLKVNGSTLDSFDKYTQTYSYELPYETTDLNVVTATPYDPAATVNIKPPVELPGEAVVQVTNGTAEKTYRISLRRGAEFPDKDIALEEFSIWYEDEAEGRVDNFTLYPDENKREFTLVVPEGTYKAFVYGHSPRTSGALVEREPASGSIILDKNARDMGSVVTTVTSRDGSVEEDYTVTFTDGNTELEAIYEDGQLLNGFDPTILEYDRFIEAYDSIPLITAGTKRTVATLEKSETNDSTYASIINLDVKQLNRDGAIHNQTTYKVRYQRYANNYLTAININGQPIESFDKFNNTYNVVLPYETDKSPLIEVVRADENANINILGSDGITSSKTIIVTGSDGRQRNYAVHFQVAPSESTMLQDLRVGSETIKGFDPLVTQYTYYVPYEATKLPSVTWNSGNDQQNITYENSALVQGEGATAQVKVLAGDGMTRGIYIINFVQYPPLKDLLSVSDIKLNGETIKDFSPYKKDYTVMLPYETITVPSISAKVSFQDYVDLTVEQGIISGTGVNPGKIHVKVKETTTSQVYTVTFKKEEPPTVVEPPSTNSRNSSSPTKTIVTDRQKKRQMKKDLEGYVENLINQGQKTKSATVAKETVKDMIKVMEYTNEITEQKDSQAGKEGKTNTEILIDLIEQAEHPISKITDAKDVITLTEGILKQVNVYQNKIQEEKELEKLRLELSSVDLAKRAISTVSTYKLSKRDLAVESDRVNIYVQDKQIEKIAKKKEDSVKKLEDEVEAIAKGKTYELESVPLVVSAPPLARRIKGVDVTIKEELINNHSVKVETDLCSFTLDSEVFGNSLKNAKDNNETITLSQTKLKKKPKEMKDIEVIDTPVMDFTAVKGETKMKVFEEPLTTSFKVDKKIYKDYTQEQLESLTVFYYNEKTEKWEPVGGRFDPVSETITTSLPHFSQYTVMLSNKSFSDVNQHWARKEINIMLRKGIIDEKADFSPIQKISRAEFSSWVSKAFNIDGQSVELPFEDIAPEDQYYKEIAAAYKKEIIKGKSETIFDSKGFISREEIAALVTRALSRYKDMPISENIQEILGSFIDREKIAKWAEKGVATAITEKLIYGYPNKSYRPQKDTQKDEAAVLIYNIYYR